MGADTNGTANGMGCLAAQVISELKTGVGGVYVVRADAASDDRGCSYAYEIHPNPIGMPPSGERGGVRLRVLSVTRNKVLYDGPISEFDPETAEPDEDEA